jgi:hypothetical protein
MSQVASASRSRRAALAAWLAVCVAVLAFTLVAYAPGPRSDAMVLFAWSMTALTFPSGLLVPALFVGITALADQTDLLSRADIPFEPGVIALWTLFSLIGYWQWFTAVPWLWRRIRHHGMPQK